MSVFKGVDVFVGELIIKVSQNPPFSNTSQIDVAKITFYGSNVVNSPVAVSDALNW